MVNLDLDPEQPFHVLGGSLAGLLFQLINAKQVHPAVAGDGLGEHPLVCGLHELVDQFGGQLVADPVAGLGRCGS